MRLSIVATLYRSAPYVATFHAQASAAARRLVGEDYELVLVNDGSPDHSLAIAVALTSADPRLTVVDLSRNFGHHKAMMTGLGHASGDLVFLIDSDLEEDPAWLDTFARTLGKADCDVVFGVQTARKGGLLERWGGATFYRLMSALSDVDMPRDMVTARLMTRRYVDALLRHREHDVDIGGLWAITGFRQQALPVVKRSTSPTTYTLRRRVVVFVRALTSFSTAPLVATLALGLALLVPALIALVALGVRWAIGAPTSPWMALLASVWLVGALMLSSIGIVALYLAKVLSEVRQRPYTIVRDIHGRRPD